MIDEIVPAVPARKGVEIDEIAYKTLCALFPYPQNSFQDKAFITLLEHGGLGKIDLTYGVAYLAYGEEAKFDPVEREILLSEATYQDLRLDVPRSRFTLAHELGHAVLHCAYLKASLEGRVPQHRYKRTTLKAYLDPEWQANRFAAAFLMPTQAIGKCLREGWSLAKIAAYFRVSRKAAQIRAEKIAH